MDFGEGAVVIMMLSEEVQRYSGAAAQLRFGAVRGPTPTLSRGTPATRWVTNVAGLGEGAGVR